MPEVRGCDLAGCRSRSSAMKRTSCHRKWTVPLLGYDTRAPMLISTWAWQCNKCARALVIEQRLPKRANCGRFKSACQSRTLGPSRRDQRPVRRGSRAEARPNVGAHRSRVDVVSAPGSKSAAEDDQSGQKGSRPPKSALGRVRNRTHICSPQGSGQVHSTRRG